MPSYHQVSLPEAVYCCLTRTTLFTTMFTVYYIVVCSLKSVCTKFHLVVSVSYMAIYVPIIMYCLRLFIVVLQELHRLRRCNFPILWVLWISISTQSFVSQLCPVIEICESKLKKKKNNKMRIVKRNFYDFNNFPVVQFWSFFEDPHILTIGTLS